MRNDISEMMNLSREFRGRMTKQEAIETIRSNWPPSNYTMLREVLTMAIEALTVESDATYDADHEAGLR